MLNPSYMAEVIPPAAHACTLGTSSVVDSRTTSNGLSIRRRRQCQCGLRFTTYETLSGLRWSPQDQRRYAQAIMALQLALEAVRKFGGVSEQALLEVEEIRHEQN